MSSKFTFKYTNYLNTNYTDTMPEALRGTAHEDRGATSQLVLPSLPSLSVAGYGRRQLGVPHLGYFSRILHEVIDVVDN